MKSFIWSIFFLGIIGLSKAQDIHYTQYSFLPALHNPASAGFMPQDIRFSAIYRNQWFTVPVNYNSLGFSFDASFLEHYKTGSKAGIGLNFYFDQAGDSRLQTLHLMLPLAYHLAIPIQDNKLKISLGVEAGIQYKSLSTNDLYYDSQFNGEVYIPSKNPEENFENLKILNPDFGTGIHFEFSTEKKLQIGLGFAVKHLNDAKEAYLKSNIKPSLRKRYVVPFYANIPINSNWDVQVSYLFNEQNKSTEHLTGVMAGYFFDNREKFMKKLSFGVFYRVLDAPSIAVQYETNQYKFGLSYDITASKFARASNTYGGVELAAKYMISTLEKPNPRYKRNCYTF